MKHKYSIKELILKPIVLKISAEEEKLREEIMSYIIKEHKAYPIKKEQQKIVESLAERNILTINLNNEVESIYPISSRPTNKKVLFDDGRYSYAMCAIDAMGFHYAFNEPITIEGECQKCGEKIKLRLENGLVNVLVGNEDIHVLHTDLEQKDNWSCCCCNIMHFFNCSENLEQWLAEQGIEDKVFSIDLELANKIAWLLFSK